MFLTLRGRWPGAAGGPGRAHGSRGRPCVLVKNELGCFAWPNVRLSRKRKETSRRETLDPEEESLLRKKKKKRGGDRPPGNWAPGPRGPPGRIAPLRLHLEPRAARGPGLQVGARLGSPEATPATDAAGPGGPGDPEGAGEGGSARPTLDGTGHASLPGGHRESGLRVRLQLRPRGGTREPARGGGDARGSGRPGGPQGRLALPPTLPRPLGPGTHVPGRPPPGAPGQDSKKVASASGSPAPRAPVPSSGRRGRALTSLLLQRRARRELRRQEHQERGARRPRGSHRRPGARGESGREGTGGRALRRGPRGWPAVRRGGGGRAAARDAPGTRSALAGRAVRTERGAEAAAPAPRRAARTCSARGGGAGGWAGRRRDQPRRRDRGAQGEAEGGGTGGGGAGGRQRRGGGPAGPALGEGRRERAARSVSEGAFPAPGTGTRPEN